MSSLRKDMKDVAMEKCAVVVILVLYPCFTSFSLYSSISFCVFCLMAIKTYSKVTIEEPVAGKINKRTMLHCIIDV